MILIVANDIPTSNLNCSALYIYSICTIATIQSTLKRMCNLLHMMCTSCCRSPIAKCTCPIAHSAIMPIDFIRKHQWQTVIKTIISICVPVCVLSFCWCAIVLKFCAWFWRCRAHSHGQKACATRPKHTHKQTNPYARWNADRNAIIIARNEPDERRRRRRLTCAHAGSRFSFHLTSF